MTRQAEMTPHPLASDETVGGTGETRAPDSAELADRVVLDRARSRLFDRPYDPIRIGRFVILRELGRGAMGVVHAGYDETLDRKVAIKLIVDRRAHTEEARGRLLREARAMARVTDPHVVHVYEAGEHEGDVFVAMEFVEGRTLRDWLCADVRSWRDVVRVFAAAGEGLAAAHRAGIVHRDFKPDNVLMTGGDVPKVADFGLAGLDHADVTSPSESGATPADVSLTRTGALLGTPMYMAPEQWSGRPSDARTDQFAFCVALFEALHGVLPFAGRNAEELAAAVMRGELAQPERGRRVPRWLHRVVARGLAVDPNARWPGMEALLAALAADPSGKRRAGIVLGGVAVVAASLFGLQRVEHARAVAECERAGGEIAEEWNDERREQVRAALLATGASYAKSTADKAVQRIDERAEAWADVRERVCTLATVDRSWPAEQQARAEDCLALRRAELRGVVARLADADETIVQHAVSAAAALSTLDGCTDPQQLARQLDIPPEAHEQVMVAREGLSRISMLLVARATDEAATELPAVVAAAEASGYVPVQAAALAISGRVASAKGDKASARTMLEDAYYRAGTGGADDVAIDAATTLAIEVAQASPRDAAALDWGRTAEMWLDRLAFGEQDLRRAAAANAVGAVYVTRGERDQARVAYERALSVYEAALGSDHPRVASALNLLASLAGQRGDHDEALALGMRALAIYEDAFGPDHPNVAVVLKNLGSSHKQRGAYAEALESNQRALAIVVAALGPDDMLGADLLNNIGNTHKLMGDLDEAFAYHERALAIREKALGPDHEDVALSIHNISLLHETRGELDLAIAGYRRAIAIYEKTLGPEHAMASDSWVGIGEIELGRGNAELAIAPLEKAVALREGGGFDPVDVAGTRFLLARALWESGRDRARAVKLAEQGRDEYRAVGNAIGLAAGDLEALERWLADESSR